MIASSMSLHLSISLPLSLALSLPRCLCSPLEVSQHININVSIHRYTHRMYLDLEHIQKYELPQNVFKVKKPKNIRSGIHKLWGYRGLVFWRLEVLELQIAFVFGLRVFRVDKCCCSGVWGPIIHE